MRCSIVTYCCRAKLIFKISFIKAGKRIAKSEVLIDHFIFYHTSPQNSKIGGADGAAVYVKGDMRKLDYFPGAEGKTDSCACGATDSCDSDEVMCNCNIEDGQAHKDFGLIIDKSDLPVTKVTAQVGNARSSTYEIGELQCSQKQFGECLGTRHSVVRSSLVSVWEQDIEWSEAVWCASLGTRHSVVKNSLVCVFRIKTQCRQEQFGKCLGTRHSEIRGSLVNIWEQDKM